ncbi:MAG TPA: hypothetical protein VHB25_08080 [Gemmatimonadaceae bacterium]|nr:hypothetical protein [Gemmatimonadaceae bacterium]
MKSLDERPVVRGAGLAAICVVLLGAAWRVRRLQSEYVAAGEPLAWLARRLDTTEDHRPHVVFVFRPADCPAALSIIDRWNAEAQRGAIDVSGIALAPVEDSASAREVVASYGIHFPVRMMPLETALARLQPIRMAGFPVSLVFDARLRLRAAIPSNPGPDEQLLESAIDAATRAAVTRGNDQ